MEEIKDGGNKTPRVGKNKEISHWPSYSHQQIAAVIIAESTDIQSMLSTQKNRLQRFQEAIHANQPQPQSSVGIPGPPLTLKGNWVVGVPDLGRSQRSQ